jgi:hypothetical protein
MWFRADESTVNWRLASKYCDCLAKRFFSIVVAAVIERVPMELDEKRIIKIRL